MACFIEDDAGLRMLDLIGSDIVCLEMDYPHSDSTWPATPERLARHISDLDADTIAAITHRNAMHHFGFDLFANASPAELSVGALRARARHIDVEPAAPRRPFVAPERPLTLLDMLTNAQHPLLDDQAAEGGSPLISKFEFQAVIELNSHHQGVDGQVRAQRYGELLPGRVVLPLDEWLDAPQVAGAEVVWPRRHRRA